MVFNTILLFLLRFLFHIVLKIVEGFIYVRRRLWKYDISDYQIINSVVPDEMVYVKSHYDFIAVTATHYKAKAEMLLLTLEDGMTLECADDHAIRTTYGYDKLVQDLRKGEVIYTENGPKRVKSVTRLGYKTYVFDITIASIDHLYYTNGILSLNSIISSIFLVWYLITNVERNIMCTSQTGDKVKELMSKIYTIIKRLPFFMKPGMVTDNVMTKVFDNGCMLVAQTTTENTGASFTIHVLYSDEFALIPEELIREFYRTLYPTLSSSEISRMIITSTPRGLNKFYEIYTDGLEGKNFFNPIRTDWYEVPGRGESWKTDMIVQLGSEEDFNQEFGNQFLAGSKLLLQSSVMKKLKRNQIRFVHRELESFESLDENILPHMENLIWHPAFDMDNLCNEACRFMISIDLADGNGGNYSVLNIFQLLPMSKIEIDNLSIYSEEKDFFKLAQIGIYRSNTTDLPELAMIFYHIVTEILMQDNTKTVLEMNHEGNYFKLMVNGLYGDENEIEDEHLYIRFLYNMGDSESEATRPGLNQTEKTRDYACKKAKDKMKYNQLVPLEFTTVEEALSFARNKKGKYVSQTGNDDCMLTCVNASHVFEMIDFIDFVDEMMEFVPKAFIKEINLKLKKDGAKQQDQINDDDYSDLLT